MRRSERGEQLDASVVPRAALRSNLEDLRRLNRLFGGTSTARRALARLPLPLDRPVTLLDIGTGSADVPAALLAAFRKGGIRPRFLCLDRNLDIVREAMDTTNGQASDLRYVRADGLHLPLADGSVDIALCSLTLHHFAPVDAVALLREMHRVSRIGLVVVDLYRSEVAYVATWLATHVFARSPMTRHDGPLSVRRSYTPRELAELAAAAGLDGADVYVHPWFRMSLLSSCHA